MVNKLKLCRVSHRRQLKDALLTRLEEGAKLLNADSHPSFNNCCSMAEQRGKTGGVLAWHVH